MIDWSVVAFSSDISSLHENLGQLFRKKPAVYVKVYFADRPRSAFPDSPRLVGISINIVCLNGIDTKEMKFDSRFIVKTIWEPSEREVWSFHKQGGWIKGSGWRLCFNWVNCLDMKDDRRLSWPLKKKEDDWERYQMSNYLLLEDRKEDPYGSVLDSLPRYLMYGEKVVGGTFAELLELEGFPMDCQDFSVIGWSSGMNSELQQIVPFDLFLRKPKRHLEDEKIEAFGNLHLCQLNVATSNVTSEWNIKNVHVSIQQKNRSNIYIMIKAKRIWNLYLWRMFIPVFLLVLGSQAAFLLSLENGAERVSLIFTAVLANVVYQLTVYAELPQIPYMTFLDWYNTFYFVLMLTILLESSVMTFLNEDYYRDNFHEIDGNQLRRVDLILGIVIVVIQFGSLIYFARWGYTISKRQEMKLKMNYYEQVNACLIPQVDNMMFTVDSSDLKTKIGYYYEHEKLMPTVKDYMAS